MRERRNEDRLCAIVTIGVESLRMGVAFKLWELIRRTVNAERRWPSEVYQLKALPYQARSTSSARQLRANIGSTEAMWLVIVMRITIFRAAPQSAHSSISLLVSGRQHNQLAGYFILAYQLGPTSTDHEVGLIFGKWKEIRSCCRTVLSYPAKLAQSHT